MLCCLLSLIKMFLHFSEQLIGVEGFCEVAVASRLVSMLPANIVSKQRGQDGEDDYGNVPRLLLRL